MWIYFNKNGEVINSLEHGTPARKGQVGDFSIFANFGNLDLSNYELATLSLVNPAGQNVSSYALMGNRLVRFFQKLPGETSIVPWVSGKYYDGYEFRFDTPVLNQAGEWKATITLFSRNIVSFTSMFIFNVEDSAFDVDEYVKVDIINSIYEAMNNYSTKNRNIYLKVMPKKFFSIEDGTVKNTDDTIYTYEMLNSFYSDVYQNYAYVEEDRSVYKVTKNNGSTQGFIYENVSHKLYNHIYTIIDSNANISISVLSKLETPPTTANYAGIVSLLKKYTDYCPANGNMGIWGLKQENNKIKYIRAYNLTDELESNAIFSYSKIEVM